MIQDKNKKYEEENEDVALPPDPETLHTTDPQEEMKGPISSLVQKTKEAIEENNKEKPEGQEDKDQ